MNHADINRIIYKQFGIKQHLTSCSLKTIAVKARFAAMLLCSEELDYSLHQIRKAYKRKSHSSVHHAIKTCRNLCDTDKAYKADVATARAAVLRLKAKLKHRKQRYNLTYRLRQKGLRVNSAERLLSINEADKELITVNQKPNELLKKHNYLIQYRIL